MKRAKTCASGQEEQGRGALGAHDLAELLDGVLGEVEEVAVRQLAALGPARRARGVDDRRDRSCGRGRAPARVEVGVGDLAALLAQLVEAPGVDGHDVAERRAARPRTCVDGARCAAVSTTTTWAPESERIHCTCSAEEVS